ncbi:MAG: GIY-YIG nuclease family protein [Planctomycetes bacterium]|nr:GIY-YIG nuclease family protein [Planctomycetota bacterium]
MPPLKDKLAALPDAPGVYLMKDARGRVLYVGKAKSLRSRVSSYFQPSADHEPRIAAMVVQVEDVETLEADSEVDALLMEARLVKDVQPRYNAMLKDDKSFTVLGISQEEYPMVFLTREMDVLARQRAAARGETYVPPGEPDKASFIGPFTSSGQLRAALKVFQRIFRFRTCTLDIRETDDKRRFFRPCLLWNIGRCTAPCADKVAREAYAEDMRNFRRMLGGAKRELLRDLRAKMKAHSAAREYEVAADVRDQIHAIEGLRDHRDLDDALETDLIPLDPVKSVDDLRELLGLELRPRVIEGTDISHLQGTDAVGSLVSFVDGVPFKSGYRRYKIRTVEQIDDYASIREVVRRRFTRLKNEEAAFPDVLMIDGGQAHLNAALAELAANGIRPPFCVGLAKHEGDHLWIAGRAEPLRPDPHRPGFRLLQYVRDEAHRFAQNYHHILRRKRTIG